MARTLMKGNEAIAEAAIRAGCMGYFGYPITPQSEVLEYMSLRMPELGRVFIQAESELAAVNMVYGAACGGHRVMTTTSSPGYSLMQETISDMASTDTPAVIVNVMRGGPGLGNIMPSQCDYLQMVKGGGNGDYSPIVLAPSTVQETVDLMALSFDLAEEYLQPVLVMSDGMLGQMMEGVDLPPYQPVDRPSPPWALDGCKGRERRIVESVKLDAVALEKVNLGIQATLARIRSREIRYESTVSGETDILVVAFGCAARIAKTSIQRARADGIDAALFRPITASPFPYDELRRAAEGARRVLVFELNAGQMLQDVELALKGSLPIDFYGRMGGIVPAPDEVHTEIRRLCA